MTTQSINIPILARVEGEGALDLEITDGAISKVQLRIYEPPRYFEKFLEGRSYDEVLDAVARICGICPVAYQMSAAHAIESIFGITMQPWQQQMRRIFYCGEWLESHALHIHMLAAPDFLGYRSAPDMAKDYPNEVRRGMRLHATGNELVKLLGARSVHPVGACVGGFYHAPAPDKVAALLEKLHAALDDAKQLVRWTASMPFPAQLQDYPCVSLRHATEYPMNEGDIVSDKGLSIPINQFDDYFKEDHIPYSTALHCLLQGKPYLVGPLARLNNNFDRLPPDVQTLARQTGIIWPSKNTFHSIVARAIEIYYAIGEAIRILSQYKPNTTPRLNVKTKAGVGFGCTEAPRGLLWHRYEVDSQGVVKSSRIVPPTSQNQARIEDDLRLSLTQFGLHHDAAKLRLHSEMVIRNYDPCISCSTHFLDLRIKRL